MPPIIVVSSRTLTRVLIGAALLMVACFAIGAGLAYFFVE